MLLVIMLWVLMYHDYWDEYNNEDDDDDSDGDDGDGDNGDDDGDDDDVDDDDDGDGDDGPLSPRIVPPPTPKSHIATERSVHPVTRHVSCVTCYVSPDLPTLYPNLLPQVKSPTPPT